MNINIKNCEVNIITGTDTLEISGNAQPAAAEAPTESTRPAESKESGCISEMTQLGQYLQSEFLRAMNGAGIPAESCGLISKDEMFGDNPLEYFKTGRNRIAFDFDEDCSRYYWLSTLYDEEASAAFFCLALSYGLSYYNYASAAYHYVRPRFVISAI